MCAKKICMQSTRCCIKRRSKTAKIKCYKLCIWTLCSNELAAVHLLKAYCLRTLTYGCEVCLLTDTDLHRITVAWNNCFRRVSKCCWRENVRPLQFFCHILPLSYIIDQRRLLFWQSLCWELWHIWIKISSLLLLQNIVLSNQLLIRRKSCHLALI